MSNLSELPSVFITGATGSVGHYVVDALAGKYRLYLLARDESRFRTPVWELPGVTVVKGDLVDLGMHAELLKNVDYCIHIATAWGARTTSIVNVHGTHRLFKLLDSPRLKRVVYFSTASIIDRNMQPLEAAGRLGTAYIKTKYEAYMQLPESPIFDKITTVFPTIVFGGDDTHPISHVSGALPQVRKYIWALARLGVDIKFHFIHGQDIASMVKYIIEAPSPEPKYVFGNKAVTLGEFLRKTAVSWNHPVKWQMNLPTMRLYAIAKALGAKMSPWDEFCAELRDFSFERATGCPDLGLDSRHSTVEELVADWSIIKHAQQKLSSS